MAYFHPKTGADAVPDREYVKVLTTTAQEVRTLLREEEVVPLPSGVRTLYDLLAKVLLNEEIPIQKIANMTSKGVSVGNMFENMWTLAFALGVVPGYENIRLLRGKIETRPTEDTRAETLAFLKRAELNRGSEGGASDISFVMGGGETVPVSDCGNTSTDTPSKQQYVFCSVKNYLRDDKKSVDQYDVTNIISAALAGGYAEDEFRVMILANNKAVVKSKFASAFRRYITYIVKKDNLDQGVLGRDDLEAAFLRLRDHIRGHPITDDYIEETFFGGKKVRPFLSLRFHQELLIRKTLDIMSDSTRSSVLWGVVARGGKTYIAGGLVREKRPKTVFIVAGAYTETHSQFLDDLFDTSKNGYQDFAEYTVIDIKNDTFESYDPAKKYIFFVSLELLKLTGTTAKERKIMELIDRRVIVPDLVFFDEVHKGGTTELADRAITLIAHSAFKVFMTATYIKPFIKPEYKIDVGNLITWGYEDIQIAKSMDTSETVQYFETKYGKDICQSVLQYMQDRGITVIDIANQYQKFPEIQFLTTTFSQEFEDSMARQNMIDAKTGFRMSTLFTVGRDCLKIAIKQRWACFVSPATVGVFLNYMGPSNQQMTALSNGTKVQTLPSPQQHITDRIGRTSQRRGDRLKNLDKEFVPHSQLWFLPQTTGDDTDKPLLSMMTCLASMIIQHPWFYRNFCIVCISSGFKRDEDAYTYEDGTGFIKFTNGGSDTKKTVLRMERDARAQNRGLIILAGRMLTLGVSLPCVNVVSLLDDSSSSDLTYQKMFRALTESEGKTLGYVVDVNPIRTLKTLYDYTSLEHDETIPEERKEPVTITTLTNLYLIDEDQLFVIGEDGKRLHDAKKLQDTLDTKLQASRKIYKSILDEAFANINTVDLSAEFEQIRTSLQRSKPEAITYTSELSGMDVPTGIERIQATPSTPSKKTSHEEAERLRSLREMVLTAMILLAFLTTDVELGDAFEKYKTNIDGLQEIIYNTVRDRGLVEDEVELAVITNVITTAMSKVMTKLLGPYRKMRTRLSEFTGDQKEVIEFMENSLKPKKEQVASRGEVFTPLSLIDEMTSHLPDEIWTHPEYKWLDPASGLAQFPVIVYAKLDEGLKSVIPDDAERRKHIVGNMLYLVELDNTNVELSKRLLKKMCGDETCKMNILKHDFLTATDDVLTSAFGVTRFNVVLGNPPYNPPKTETGSSGNAIWQNFVMKMESLLEPNGFICVVHPPGWKKPTEDVYKPEKFTSGNYKGQVRQGQVWQTLKARGSFPFIYTNDQKSKTVEHIPNFPAFDYYVFQSGVNAPTDTHNVFYGTIFESTSIQIPSELPFLPCLITTETITVLQRLIAKDGLRPKFKAGFDPRGFKKREKGTVQYLYEANAKGPLYQNFSERHETVDMSKVAVNYIGGIDGYYAKYIDASEQIGVLHHSMYYPVASAEDGRRLEAFLNSNLMKCVFLITQYSSGQRTLNEPLVVNSIPIPPDGVDPYTFFGIKEFEPFLEQLLALYTQSKGSKRAKASEPRHETPRQRPKTPEGHTTPRRRKRVVPVTESS